VGTNNKSNIKGFLIQFSKGRGVRYGTIQ
jgi:hypothetical protein